jgi:hypothetical protein
MAVGSMAKRQPSESEREDDGTGIRGRVNVDDVEAEIVRDIGVDVGVSH